MLGGTAGQVYRRYNLGTLKSRMLMLPPQLSETGVDRAHYGSVGLITASEHL